MPRLDKERQKDLEPQRIQSAIEKLNKIGFAIITRTETFITFNYRGSIVTFYPYSGWATGKSIKDGRGLNNLLKQLK